MVRPPSANSTSRVSPPRPAAGGASRSSRGVMTARRGAGPMPVYGVGLVTGLANTGGEAPPGDERKLLEKELQRFPNVNSKAVLSSKDMSLVVLSALVPPGAQKGDPIDIKVTLPAGSK